jgi:predicted Zn-ribbon and HTH transcriptional regulator
MKPKPPPVPAPRLATLRREIEALLAGEPLSAREISTLLGIPERTVGEHLRHIRRSLHRQGRTLLVTPPVCHLCGFVFARRERLERPGKCPACRGQSIADPRFAVR